MKCPRCQFDNPDNTRYCGQCGRELPGAGESAYAATLALQGPTGRLERGTTFAERYEVIEALGQGGMGAVYKAYDTKIKDNVALKLLRPEIVQDTETIERFRNEIKLARRISHRHVCRMYDLGEEGMTAYITMEFVSGEDLKTFIRRSGHLTEAKTVAVGKQIAAGLAEAHHFGVIHRDLKPQNVMIDREGNAKIMDFGIARSVRSKSLTGTGIVIGTPEYMSPEQAEAKSVDHRTDIYALGVLLYEMVTGRVPFEGETPLSVAIKHKSEPPRDPRLLNPQVSPSLSQVILRCLVKEKEGRYQKADEILDDLERIEKGMPTAQRVIPKRKPITSKEITVKFTLRKALFPALAAVAVFALLVVVWRGRSGRQVGAPQEAAAKPGPAITDIQRKPSEPSASLGTSPDESKVLKYLVPLFSEASKYLKEEDIQKIDKVLSEIKPKLPSDSAFVARWSDIQTRVQEGRKHREAGNIVESKKSYSKSESEMRKLLNMVNDRERADLSKGQMEEYKKTARSSQPADAPNLLFWIAMEKEKDAAEAYQKNDYSGARILYNILGRVYQLSARAGDDERCLRLLLGLATEIRLEAEKAGAPAVESWLFQRAREEEARAQTFAQGGQSPEAAEFFILASFLYEKARNVALESAQTGQK